MDENIYNLTALWRTVGTTCGVYCDEESFSYSHISNSQWPNRIWLSTKADELIINKVLVAFDQSEPPMSLSYWADFGDPTFKVFEREGLQFKSEQVGMSLELPNQSFVGSNRVELQYIASDKQTELWEELYPQCFGYAISANTIKTTMDQIDYFLIYHNNIPIGTVIAFNTNFVVGIHGMGILPSYRKQGFAKEALLELLNLAIEQKKTLATLQASTMGKAIYKSIGFTEDFLLRNYRLDS